MFDCPRFPYKTYPTKQHFPILLLYLIALAFSKAAYPEQNSQIFSFKGFGSLAGTGTDTNAIGFRRDTSISKGAKKSWDILTDSRLGFQVDAKFNEAWSGTIQWTLRQRTGNFFEQNLDLAFLRWNIDPDFYVRFGRIAAESHMLSDHRNVGYAYLWMRPPHEFYASIPLYHYDGVDITKKFSLDGGYLTLKAFGGYTFNQLDVNDTIYDQGATVFTGAASYEKGDWRFHAGYSHLDITTESSGLVALRQTLFSNPLLDLIWPGLKGLSNDLTIKNKVVQYGALGVAYDDGLWIGQAEASYVDTNTVFYPSVASGYVSLGRRLSSFTFYGLLGISESLHYHIDVPKPVVPAPQLLTMQQNLNYLLNQNGIDEQSVSLGLRWDFYENMAFKTQWSHYWLGQNGSQNWVKDQSQTPPDQVNVFSVGIDFMF